MNRPKVRDDLGALEGYHSPQVDVDVRLNTNESPEPPPDAWRDALAAELSRVDWHRYPDRSALALRSAIAELHHVAPEQVFAANGSNEVLQTLLLAYGGPDRRALTFEPTYQLHSHIARITGTTVVEADRTADFQLDLAVAEQAIRPRRSRRSRSSARPTTPRASSRRRPPSGRSSSWASGLVVVDEAYGQFSPWSALTLIDEAVPLVVTRTYSKTWSMAAARLGYLIGPSWLVAELDKVTLPYHLDATKQIAGRIALSFVDEMETRVARVVEERERLVSALCGLGATVWPSGANFVLFRPMGPGGERLAGRAVWQASARPLRPGAGLLVVASARRLPAGHDRHAARERSIPERARGGSDMTVRRDDPQASARRPGRRRSTSSSWSTEPGRLR